jgi:hypothetical protein
MTLFSVWIIIGNVEVARPKVYRFLVPTSTDPWLVSNISAGFAPASFKEFLTQPFIAFIGRFVVLWETSKYRAFAKKFNK